MLAADKAALAKELKLNMLQMCARHSPTARASLSPVPDTTTRHLL